MQGRVEETTMSVGLGSGRGEMEKNGKRERIVL